MASEMRNAMKRLMALALATGMVFFSGPLAAAPKKPSKEPPQKPEGIPGLPRVLLIGDSISIGYTRPVIALLKGKANVRRIPGNGQHTGTGLAKLQSWLGDEKWDVIHFNWGLWDLCYRNPESKTQGNRDKINGKITFTLAEYEKNLTELVKRLKAAKAKLIWASTTPVPDGEAGRVKGDDLKYNAAAKKIMDAHGIAINDLHAHILPKAEEFYTAKGNVHFNAAGNQYLAEKVAAGILEALGQKPPAPKPAPPAKKKGA